MELLMKENERIRKKFVTAMEPVTSKNMVETSNLSNLLQLLLTTAQENAGKKPQKRIYNATIKEFSSMIFILGGVELYQIFAANLGFPSLTTVRRGMHLTEKISEGEFRFEPLKSYLLSRGYPLKVWISEDGSNVNGRVQYDSKTNQVVGLVPRLQANGVPEFMAFSATSASTIRQYFENFKVSSNVYVFMAQPLAPKSAGFCLAIFGTDNKFNSDQVFRRFEWLHQEAKKHDVEILGFSADGDPKVLKAMVEKSLRSIPSQWSWFNPAALNPMYVCIQDMIHLVVKLKTRLLKPSGIYPFGKSFVASSGHIVELINVCSKDLHELTISFINSKDKMNFKAAQKLCDSKVTSLLPSAVPGSNATACYLVMMREVMNSFLDPTLSPLERIELIWKWVFFLRDWRSWIQTTDGYNLKNNFITSNAYTCIEVNAHGLIQIIQKLRESECHELFLPWLFSSQTCEGFFRKARSLTTIQSTQTNFSNLELVHRIRRIDMLSESYNNLQNVLNFPRAKKAAKQIQEQACSFFMPEDFEIEASVMRAYDSALELCRKFKICTRARSKNPPPLSIPNLHSIEEENDDDTLIDSALVQTDEEDNSENQAEITEFLNLRREEAENVIEDICVVSSRPLGIKTFSDAIVSPESPFVKVVAGNKQCIIRKSTFVWLLASGDTRLSSDRLHRVKTSEVKHLLSMTTASISSPTIEDTVEVGDWCAFTEGKSIYIGQILSFSYMSGTTPTSQQYSSLSAPTSPPAQNARGIGCLCSWFIVTRTKYMEPVSMDVHGYHNLDTYICTVPHPKVVDEKLFMQCSIQDIKKCKHKC